MALAVGALIGFLNGVGIMILRIPPLVMTLGMAGVVQGTVLVVTQGALAGGTPPALANFVLRQFLGLPGSFILWVLLAAALGLVLERSIYGKSFAVGIKPNNRKTFRCQCTTRRRHDVHIKWFVIGLFGGFVLLGFTQRVFLNLGNPYLFPSIAAVVVGGTVLAGGKGSYWGTMAGALVLTLIDSLLRV